MKRWYWIIGVLVLVIVTLMAVLGQRSQQVKLPSKKPMSPKPIKISESMLKSLTPAGYTVKKWIQADLDRDKMPELILACQSQSINYDGAENLPAKILVFTQENGQWKKIWDFKEMGKNPDFLVGKDGNGKDDEPILEVKDVNQDGYLELVFSFGQTFGAGGLSLITHVCQSRDGKFLNLAGIQLAHDADGGAKFGGKFACAWSYIWGSDESHAGPHRYKVGIYEWNGKQYTKKQEFQTSAKGEEGEKELKQNFQRVLQGKPLLVKKPAEPELMSGLDKDSVDEAIKADLKKAWRKAKSATYIVDSDDRQYFQSGKEDIRVLRMLEELTKNKGHILAVRVKSGYHTSGYSVSRESDPGWNNESSHYTAQAFDIFYADGVEIGWQATTDSVARQKAQSKIRQLMKEILEFGSRNSSYLPTQLCVYKRDDIMAFSKEARMLYGGYPPETGLRGMMTGDRYWDRIHVGY